MKRRISKAFILPLLSLAAAALMMWDCAAPDDARALSAPRHVSFAHSPPEPDGTPRPTGEDLCPITAIRVREHMPWACSLTTRGGRAFYFCSPRFLFLALQTPRTLLGIPPDDVDQVWVTDYDSKAPIDGRSAAYMAGSDQMGPLGPDLVPLADPEAARAFRAAHGGTGPLGYAQISHDVLDALYEGP